MNFLNKYYINSSGRHDGPFHYLRDSAANPKVTNGWQDSLIEADSESLIKACELIKLVRKYITVSQVTHDLEGNKA